MSFSSEHPGVCHWETVKHRRWSVANSFLHFSNALKEWEHYEEFVLPPLLERPPTIFHMEVAQKQYELLVEYRSFVEAIRIYGLPKGLEREYDDLNSRLPKFIVSYDHVQRVITYRPLMITSDRYTPDGHIIFDSESDGDHSSEEQHLVMLPARQHRF